MTSSELLLEAYRRVHELVERAVKDASARDLAFRPDPDSNSISWLVWHLTRVQDDHLSDLQGLDECWIADGWHERSGVPFAAGATGNGHSREEVAQLANVPVELIMGYHNAVTARTVNFLATLNDQILDRVIDTSYNPPVTLGVRLVSVLSDNLQHAGQALFVRGIVGRRLF